MAPASHQLSLGETREILNHRGEAMIHSSHRNPKTKAIAEVLAMIADAHPDLAAQHPRPVPLFLFSRHPETGEWLWESATEFCAALDRYAAIKKRTNY